MSLVAWYPLQDSGNNSAVASLTGLTGNIVDTNANFIVNSNQISRTGPNASYPRALMCSGTSGVLVNATASGIGTLLAGATGISVAAYVYINTTSNNYLFFQAPGLFPNNGVISIGQGLFAARDIWCSVGSNDTPPAASKFKYTNSPQLTLGSWKHVTATVDYINSEIKFYLSGTEVASTWADGIPISYPNSHTGGATGFKIGGFYSSSNFSSNTVMADVRVYDHVLSTGEIRNILDNAVLTNLVGYSLSESFASMSGNMIYAPIGISASTSISYGSLTAQTVSPPSVPSTGVISITGFEYFLHGHTYSISGNIEGNQIFRNEMLKTKGRVEDESRTVSYLHALYNVRFREPKPEVRLPYNASTVVGFTFNFNVDVSLYDKYVRYGTKRSMTTMDTNLSYSGSTISYNYTGIPSGISYLQFVVGDWYGPIYTFNGV